MFKKKTAMLAYFVSIHLLLVVALVKTDLVERVSEKLHLTKPRIPEEDSIIPKLRQSQQLMDESIPSGITLFLGDSITMALATPAVVKYSINLGIGWQRSDQLLRSMENYKSINRAARVVVAIGTNDLLQGREAGIETRYKAILDRIPGNVNVVMNSVPPIGDVNFYGVHRVDDAEVKKVVEIARAVCAADTRCKFVDVYAALTSGGKPTPGALMPDQIHLTPKGYKLMIAAMKSVISSDAAD